MQVFIKDVAYIDVRYHWIRDVLNSKQMQIEKVHTDDNGADMLTNVVTYLQMF